MKRLVAVIWLLVCALPVSAQPGGADDALSTYVAKPDTDYEWVMRRTGSWKGNQFAELIMTSQNWRDTLWKHQLYMIRPKKLNSYDGHALLVIDGGRWKDELESPASDETLPRRVRRYARIANRIRTPIVIVRQVPFQPMFGGMTEDRIIAYTFEQYLDTGEPDWPLLLPMVKSAVRAMDTAQEFFPDHWSLPVETFTVVGASKRGWTTWLTAAVDERVTALAPVVIDVVNMGPQIEYQEAVWGAVSEKIGPYTERNLHKRLVSDAGASLREIVDPYSYRDRIKQPKLIVIGTNDRYWPLDALNLYWDDLLGPKYALYVPNNRHGIKDYRRLIGSVNALHQNAANGAELPALSWQFDEKQNDLTLTVGTDVRPKKIRAWIAQAPTRDFREVEWSSKRFKKNGDAYVFTVERPAEGFVAVFGEAVFGPRRSRAYFSTNVLVVGKTTTETHATAEIASP